MDSPCAVHLPAAGSFSCLFYHLCLPSSSLLPPPHAIIRPQGSALSKGWHIFVRATSSKEIFAFPGPGETYKHSLGSHLHSIIELQVGTPEFLPCLHLHLEVCLQINNFLPCASQLWKVADDTLLPFQIALRFPAITGQCYCRDRTALPSSKMLLGGLIVLKEGFADWGRAVRGWETNRQDRRGLRSAKIRASKEQEDEQKERSTLVNIMSGIIFPMCHSPTRGWGHFLLFETFGEFWVWYSKAGKHPW